jgi:hypothetical protein
MDRLYPQAAERHRRTVLLSPHEGRIDTTSAVPPIPILIGGGEAFHKHIFEGREILPEEEIGPATNRALDAQDLQQDREVRVQYWRGVFLDRFFALDHNLGAIVAEHFAVTHETMDEWNHLLLGRVSFNQKRLLINEIIRSRGLGGQFPHLVQRLQTIGSFRNVLAHGMLEPIGDDDMVTFLYYRNGTFDARQFRWLEIWLNVLRLQALNWDVVRLSSEITGSEKFDPLDLEGVRRLDAVRQGPCPACGIEGAGLMYELAKDAWTEPDWSAGPQFVACPNPECERYEPEVGPGSWTLERGFLAGTAAITVSIAVGIVAALGLGAAIGAFTGRSRLRTAFRQLSAATIAATITFGVGALLGVSTH